jgi:hypothetical protein
MKSSLRLAVVGAACWLLAAANLCAIDFTPRYADLNEDGIRVRTMYIQDGPQQVFLSVPAGWTPSLGGGGLTLQSTRLSQAVIQIREAGAPPRQFDEAWKTSASASLLKSLPPESKNAAITSEKPNPVGGNGWKSFALFSSFDYFGQRLGRAQCVIALDGARALEVICTTQEKDVGSVFQQAMAVMASWYVVKTGPAAKAPTDKAAPAEADSAPAPAASPASTVPAAAPKAR